jgi:dipeptidyl aminopeptidase/acylaminoacyl peptidase
VLPAGFDARDRVHEYGGGANAVRDGLVVFSNRGDDRLYRIDGGEPRPITGEGAWRYADLQIDAARNRVLCIREDHSSGGEAVNTLAAVSLDGESGGGTVLVEGADFYSTPRLSPDGDRLAWLSWNHPNMPWDGCDLWVAPIQPDGSLGAAEHVAGGPTESIFQPEWSPAGELWFVSDRTGWWNLYRRRGGADEAVAPEEAEFGAPQWVFGMSTYAFADANTVVAASGRGPFWRLNRIDVATLRRTPVESPYVEFDDVVGGGGAAVFVAGGLETPAAVVRYDLASGAFETLKSSLSVEIAPADRSVPQPIDYVSLDGETAHALYYPPANAAYSGPAGELPPLIVRSHGGPTGAASATFNPSIQYWTSRGLAVLDVDYGGSSGYGRAYRQRLNDRWGIVDVDDCVAGALALAERGMVDRERLAIRGGSASGYTTLAALAFRDLFRAGASHYGISDLETMTTDTHKFESRYLDGLLGPYPARRDVYVERSPIHFVERISAPLILFQGSEDKVVPPDQAEKMFDAVVARGLPAALVVFEGEGHGFRRAENIKRSLEGELYFYGRVFGFTPAGEIEPVEIVNL